jgi:hypothetical protein
MRSLAPELTHESVELLAKLEEKELEIAGLKANYNLLSSRFRSHLATLSMLFAAQIRHSVQPELCRKCVSCLLGAYECEDFGDEMVSMTNYLPALAKALISNFDERIKMATSIDPHLVVNFRRAHCIGLVYAEAASNALKHAFPGLSSGVVYASLRCDGGALELSVADNGNGFDEKSLSLADAGGLRFMRDLAGQIDGELRIKTSHVGTTVSLVCPAA